ncbi:N-acetyltransferase 10 [Dinochytrium kinnereticum]|nr:N-acetyltransferase 10 [Dinochytrium kinnereticum]
MPGKGHTLSQGSRRPRKTPTSDTDDDSPLPTTAPTAKPVKKKLDPRIPALINNGVQRHHRSFFVLVGDRGRDQVVTLHFLLAKARVSARPAVVWCYKKELGFSSHRKKRMNQIKKQIERGQREVDEDDPFELFISSTSIRYTYYKETEKILGQTFGMCILQDFEALTPNLMARTIETVEGGGIVVILLKTMSSLKQLYTMTMDVHSRYRTEAHTDTVARFNERFILSLGSCETCLVLDDELNVLPLSAGKGIKALPRSDVATLTPAEQELADLKTSLADTQPIGNLVSVTKTVDQARAVLTFVEAIAEKTLRTTVALTAARGRGKSAALGVAVGAAVAYGYSNIFITSPSPENLRTLFEFLFKAFDALGYEEHLDYDIIQSTNPEFQKAVVRVNIFRQHRQTIQYIQPTDHAVLAQAELLIIDEAAAIPLPIVKNLLGPYLIFMASTINGYEGTGRSLSLKLIAQLREQSAGSAATAKLAAGGGGVLVNRDGKERKDGASANAASSAAAPASLRVLREIKLEEPIRYGAGDAVEAWLTKLLCLDACNPAASGLVGGLMGRNAGCPHPSSCELYYVNRDTLFSFHPVSEAFLQRMMGLYVASHYKNSPNDLQLLSDAPAHHLFVLLPPIDKSKVTALPEPLVVIQVCMEGKIAKGTALSSLARGVRSSGDLIPWVVSQQFQDEEFASLSGARVVRIATHPDYVGMGYGAFALGKLEEYFEGREANGLSEEGGEGEGKFEMKRVSDEELENANLQADDIHVRDPSSMPPLLLRLSERPPTERLHWLGVSYGLTPSLFKFWKRSGYVPVYVRQTTNELTGEHTSIMLKPLKRGGADLATLVGSGSGGGKRSRVVDDESVVTDEGWIKSFSWDFRRRFVELLGFQFRKFPPIVVMSVLESCKAEKPDDSLVLKSRDDVRRYFTPYDLKRLDSYTQNLLDYHVIIDLVPSLARLYFMMQLDAIVAGPTDGETDKTSSKGVHLSPVQAAILIGIGLQHKTMEELATEIDLPVSQTMALFGKIVRKCAVHLAGIEERGIAAESGLLTSSSSSSSSLKKKGDGAGDEDVMDEDVEEGESGGRGVKRALDDEEAWDPTKVGLEDDLEEAGNEAMAAFRKKQKELISGLDLSQYAITADDEELKQVGNPAGKSIIQVKNAGSTKKRRYDSAAGTAADLAAGVKGEKTGIFDPQAARGKTIKGKKTKVKK